MLGTGMVGRTIADKLLDLGHEVCLGARSQDNSGAQEWADLAGPSARSGSFAQAGAFGEMVFNCTVGSASVEALKSVGQELLSGKILIDVANPLVRVGDATALTVCNTDSLGEQIQQEFPSSLVVKALNTMNCQIMVEPSLVPGTHNVFICGDNVEAKKKVVELLRAFGWPESDIIDLGGIVASRGTEMYLPLWVLLRPTIGTAHYNLRIVS
jgi:8-hydroxy-5-deazaflavin:NADPH oxidoreductase